MPRPHAESALAGPGCCAHSCLVPLPSPAAGNWRTTILLARSLPAGSSWLHWSEWRCSPATPACALPRCQARPSLTCANSDRWSARPAPSRQTARSAPHSPAAAAAAPSLSRRWLRRWRPWLSPRQRQHSFSCGGAGGAPRQPRQQRPPSWAASALQRGSSCSRRVWVCPRQRECCSARLAAHGPAPQVYRRCTGVSHTVSRTLLFPKCRTWRRPLLSTWRAWASRSCQGPPLPKSAPCTPRWAASRTTAAAAAAAASGPGRAAWRAFCPTGTLRPQARRGAWRAPGGGGWLAYTGMPVLHRRLGRMRCACGCLLLSRLLVPLTAGLRSCHLPPAAPTHPPHTRQTYKS